MPFARRGHEGLQPGAPAGHRTRHGVHPRAVAHLGPRRWSALDGPVSSRRTCLTTATAASTTSSARWWQTPARPALRSDRALRVRPQAIPDPRRGSACTRGAPYVAREAGCTSMTVWVRTASALERAEAPGRATRSSPSGTRPAPGRSPRQAVRRRSPAPAPVDAARAAQRVHFRRGPQSRPAQHGPRRGCCRLRPGGPSGAGGLAGAEAGGDLALGLLTQLSHLHGTLPELRQVGSEHRRTPSWATPSPRVGVRRSGSSSGIPWRRRARLRPGGPGSRGRRALKASVGRRNSRGRRHRCGGLHARGCGCHTAETLSGYGRKRSVGDVDRRVAVRMLSYRSTTGVGVGGAHDSAWAPGQIAHGC